MLKSDAVPWAGLEPALAWLAKTRLTKAALAPLRTSGPLITRSLSFDQVPFTLTFPGITDLLSDMCPVNP